MGWHRVAKLDNDSSLWSRGGVNGVYVSVGDSLEEHRRIRVEIPDSVIWEIVAHELVQRRISEAEQMTTGDVLNSIGVKDVKIK